MVHLKKIHNVDAVAVVVASVDVAAAATLAFVVADRRRDAADRDAGPGRRLCPVSLGFVPVPPSDQFRFRYFGLRQVCR